MLFTYFQNVSKVDRTCKLLSSLSLNSETLIEGYPELIEKTEDMSQNYKDELVKFIKYELKTADKELDKAIKNTLTSSSTNKLRKRLLTLLTT